MDEDDHFFALFDHGDFPWTDTVVQQIEQRRVDMADILIFDTLLSAGGITQADTLYPPRDPDSLRLLLNAIEGSRYDALKRDCLIYFLLAYYKDGREEDFQQQKCIPPQFAALATAYWHLDTGVNVEKAVALLSDSRLNQDNSSKVMQAISLSENPAPLLLKYVRTAKPLLTEPDDLKLYVTALASSSLLDAWQFMRTFAEGTEARERLVRNVLNWCFNPPQSIALQQLLAFPLSPYEEKHLNDYALHPPNGLSPHSIAVAQSLVCVRLIQSGKYTEAIKIDRQFVLDGSPAQRKAAKDRREMMDDIIAALPLVERELLTLELDEIAKGAPAPTVNGKVKPAASTKDISMSWEVVPPVNEPVAPLRQEPPKSTLNSSLFNPKPATAPVFATSPSSAPSSAPAAAAAKPLTRTFLAPAPSPLFNPVPAQEKSNVFSASSTSGNFFTSTASRKEAPARPNLFSFSSVTAVPKAPEPEPPAPDVDMESDLDEIVIRRQTTPRALAKSRHVEDTAPQGSSLFQAPEPQDTLSISTRTIPGGFASSEEEQETPSKPIQTRRISARTRAEPSASTRQTRAQSSKTLSKADLGRSIPGSFMDDDEDEDQVAPLQSPPVKSVRRGRSSVGPSQPTSVRRSSRLSMAPSVDSSRASSPEMSPVRVVVENKKKKGARMSKADDEGKPKRKKRATKA